MVDLKTSDLGNNILAKREREILQLISGSYRAQEIATQIKASVETEESYRTNLMRKLDMRYVASLSRYAFKYGLFAVGR